jgi:hypothetical protein
LSNAELLIVMPGARADELVACMTARLDPSGISVLRPHTQLVLVDDPGGESDRALRDRLTDELAGCDPHWRHIAVLPDGKHRQTIKGSER